MRNFRYVVRVVHHGEIPDEFIEALRYAGIIQAHPTGLDSRCFDLIAPAFVSDSRRWAETNADRMRTFGFNAQAAPTNLPPITNDTGGAVEVNNT